MLDTLHALHRPRDLFAPADAGDASSALTCASSRVIHEAKQAMFGDSRYGAHGTGLPSLIIHPMPT